MNKNRIEGAAKQGERANDRKAFVIKAGSPVLYIELPYWTHQREKTRPNGMDAKITDAETDKLVAEMRVVLVSELKADEFSADRRRVRVWEPVRNFFVCDITFNPRSIQLPAPHQPPCCSFVERSTKPKPSHSGQFDQVCEFN